jgi:hypothetical protein
MTLRPINLANPALTIIDLHFLVMPWKEHEINEVVSSFVVLAERVLS